MQKLESRHTSKLPTTSPHKLIGYIMCVMSQLEDLFFWSYRYQQHLLIQDTISHWQLSITNYFTGFSPQVVAMLTSEKHILLKGKNKSGDRFSLQCLPFCMINANLVVNNNNNQLYSEASPTFQHDHQHSTYLISKHQMSLEFVLLQCLLKAPLCNIENY